MKNVLIIEVNFVLSPPLYLTSTNYIPLQDVFFSVTKFVMNLETIFNNKIYTVKNNDLCNET